MPKVSKTATQGASRAAWWISAIRTELAVKRQFHVIVNIIDATPLLKGAPDDRWCPH